MSRLTILCLIALSLYDDIDVQITVVTPDNLKTTRTYQAYEGHVNSVTQAVVEIRAYFLRSPAKIYVSDRSVKAIVVALYGLGYGLPAPFVDRDTAMAAHSSGLILRSGTWLWAESVVYADPPVGKPTVLNCRYLPDQYLLNYRLFQIKKNHRTWGNRAVPLGSWRIKPTTQMIMVVEGLFDMLVGTQIVRDKNPDDDICVVYTNGSDVAAPMLEWFKSHSQKYDFLLIRDPDEAGEFWQAKLLEMLGKKAVALTPPGKQDPDELFLSGWWPSAL